MYISHTICNCIYIYVCVCPYHGGGHHLVEEDGQRLVGRGVEQQHRRQQQVVPFDQRQQLREGEETEVKAETRH